jgi:hypothetical protein
MRATPVKIQELVRQSGYGCVKRAIHASYWELYAAGYNRKEMKEALCREFGTEDEYIRNIIYFTFHG